MVSRVAVVTGGNRGLGLEIVRALCKQFDGRVYLTSRSLEKGEQAVKTIQDEGLKCNHHPLDVEDTASIISLKDYMLKSYGGIDILVNNAGQKKLDAAEVRQMFSVNYFGALNVSNILLPVANPGSRIVNMSGMVCITAMRQCSKEVQTDFLNPEMTLQQLSLKMIEYANLAACDKLQSKGYPDVSSAYGMSKIAVNIMTKIQSKLLHEQGRNDILLNCCCPGWSRTDMGGPKAPQSPEKGAETPVYLALLPKGQTAPHGEYVSAKKVRKWW